MPEGQSRAEGEQAGSRIEQGPERRGNTVLANCRHPTAPTGRLAVSETQPALKAQSKVSGKMGTQLYSRGSGRSGGTECWGRGFLLR